MVDEKAPAEDADIETRVEQLNAYVDRLDEQLRPAIPVPADPALVIAATHDHRTPAPVREIARRILAPLLPDGWDAKLTLLGESRPLSFDDDVRVDMVVQQVRQAAQGADRAAFLADAWQRWTAAREADPDAHHSRRGRSHVTSIGDFSATLQVWRSTAREEQFLQEAKRRAVAVVYSRELLMPAWAMAAILAAAPPDARLAQVHQEWTTLDNVLVIHSALFPEVPEGVCPPRLSASWDMVRQVVSVDWPIRPDHFEAKGES